MDVRSLLSVLRRHNPWLDDPLQQKTLLARTIPPAFVQRRARFALQAGQLTLVVGPRQAGKSTWIRHSLLSYDAPLLVLHADDPLIVELCQSPALALGALAPVMRPNTTIVFEEVQRLRDASLFLKGMVDLEPQRLLVATGSASFQLGSRTRESLAGRTRRTLLLPFSLSEVAMDSPGEVLPGIAEERLRQHWEKLLIVGGYPRVWLDDDPTTTLAELTQAFVLRDVSDLHRVEHPAAFRKILRLAAVDVGNLVNISAWATAAGVARDTVTRYLEIAEDSHLVQRVPPFAGGKRAEITGSEKVFFIDNGLRNDAFGGFGASGDRSDRGALWENAMFGELLKNSTFADEIFFWRSKNGAEVDFVVQRRGNLVAFEVKSAALTRPQLSRSARSFVDAYKPRCLALINATLRLDTEQSGTPVLYRRPWEVEEVLRYL